VIKEILFRVAERTKITVTLVANQSLAKPPSPFIKSIRVSPGFDVADNYIVQQANKDDLIITADIPLAAEVIEKGAHALNPRGELYSTETIKQKLVMRDLMDELRGSGEVTGGPPPLNQRDRREFANQLDRFVEKYK
jgi:hypothetical protein